MDKTYNISQAKIKRAQEKYKMIDHKYELILEKNAIITLSHEFIEPIHPTLNISTIEMIQNMEINTTVDIIGVVLNIDKEEEKSTIYGKRAKLRKCILVDESQHKIQMALWGDFSSKEGKELQVSFKIFKIIPSFNNF